MGLAGKLCLKEASKQPRKHYNILVPALFPRDGPAPHAAFDASTTRRIDKVLEYVEENIQRAPKVSRRLWRRIANEHSRANGVGHLKVGVHTYIALLHQGSSRDYSMYAKELLLAKNAVIPLLIRHNGSSTEDLDRCALGLELLAHFLEVQSTAEYASVMSDLIKESHDMLLLPDSKASTERSAASLRVLRTYVYYSQRLSIPCQRLEDILGVCLTRLASKDKPEERVLDVGLIDTLGLGEEFTSGDVGFNAELLLKRLILLASDTTSGELVVSAALQALMKSPGWPDGAAQKQALNIVQGTLAECNMEWLLLSCALRELANEELPERVALPLVLMLHEQAGALPSAFLIPGLVRVLQSTDHCLKPDKPERIQKEVTACVHALTGRVDDPTLVLEALGGCLRGCESTNADSTQQRLHAVHVALQGLTSGSQASPITYLPTAIVNELLRLATTPSPSTPESAPVHATANGVLGELIRLPIEDLKLARAEHLQDALALQLDVKNTHSPDQLASAANAFTVAFPRLPQSALPRTSALLATIAAGAADPSDIASPSHRLELLMVTEYCARALVKQSRGKAPDRLLPEDAYAGLAITERDGTLHVRERQIRAEKAASALSSMSQRNVESFFQQVASAVTSSGAYQDALREASGPEPSREDFWRFNPAASVNGQTLDSPDAQASTSRAEYPAATSPMKDNRTLLPFDELQQLIQRHRSDEPEAKSSVEDTLKLLDSVLDTTRDTGLPPPPVTAMRARTMAVSMRQRSGVPPPPNKSAQADISSLPSGFDPFENASIAAMDYHELDDHALDNGSLNAKEGSAALSAAGMSSYRLSTLHIRSPSPQSMMQSRAERSPTGSVTGSVFSTASQRRRAIHVLPPPRSP